MVAIPNRGPYGTPMGRCGEPEDVAGVVSFLANADAFHITGQTIFVDGGRAGLNYTVPVDEPPDLESRGAPPDRPGIDRGDP